VNVPSWYLEGFESGSNKVLRIALINLPFTVGRRSSCSLPLNSPQISQLHAEFFTRGSELWIRDHTSTNGTFVNGQRLETEQMLRDGDIVHFSDLEFRLQEANPSTVGAYSQTLRITEGKIHSTKFRELREMLQLRAVQTLCQPIIKLQDRSLLGYELLGQGFLEGLPMAPKDLFTMAETLGLACELSALFRDKGLEEVVELPNTKVFFVNTHPLELNDHTALLDSLALLRSRHPACALVLEIHESAITNPTSLKSLSQDLSQLDIGIAFDDFGTGQARLLELADVAPRYIKFDGSLIHNLHRVSQKRRDLVKTLVGLVLDMGIEPIAEGIEKPREAEICADFGFLYGQGYLFGHPLAPADVIEKEFAGKGPD
jgi:EAL domain-containing protein (putative c-di-GMP-specific phosphodiesterase class I)